MTHGRLPLRWVVIFVYMLASALNYMDRVVLGALAPTILEEFRMSKTDYGFLLSGFSVCYALSAPFAGLFLDRIGLRLGMTLSVALWSLASAGRGLAGGFREMLLAMAALGVTESAAIPGSGKANAVYLKREETALGAAVNQIGLGLGGALAPLLAAWIAFSHGWRLAFFVTGLLGLAWIPMWLAAVGTAPAAASPARGDALPVASMLREPRLWGLIVANMLVMTFYSLWTNWTTLFLVETYGLTQEQANLRYVWIPPILAGLGGLAGGWLAFQLMRAGLEARAARLRICGASAVLLLASAGIPGLPAPGLAAAAIGLSAFVLLCFSVNLYAMPLDFYGPSRAAFSVGALTFAYGLMQAFFSPAVGVLIDRYGFGPAFTISSVLPLAAFGVLQATARRARRQA